MVSIRCRSLNYDRTYLDKVSEIPHSRSVTFENLTTEPTNACQIICILESCTAVDSGHERNTEDLNQKLRPKKSVPSPEKDLPWFGGLLHVDSIVGRNLGTRSTKLFAIDNENNVQVPN